MAMRATTVRFSEDLWELLEREAEREGVSTAQFLRDAALIRIGALAGRRGDRDARLTVEEIAQRSRRRRLPPVARDPARLAAVRATRLLDSAAEEAFDRVAGLARRVLHAPVALVTLIDADRQYFKACLGLRPPWSEDRQTPLSHSFCQYPVESGEPLIVPDAREHPVLRESPAIADLGVIAYAGVPLITPDGYAIGTLCVIDDQPRHWTTDQVQVLRDLAATLMAEINGRIR